MFYPSIITFDMQVEFLYNDSNEAFSKMKKVRYVLNVKHLSASIGFN